jgi:hypothetical protein
MSQPVDVNGGAKMGGTFAKKKGFRGISNEELAQLLEKEMIKKKLKFKSAETSVGTHSQGRMTVDTNGGDLTGGPAAKKKGNRYKDLSTAEIAQLYEEELTNLKQRQQKQRPFLCATHEEENTKTGLSDGLAYHNPVPDKPKKKENRFKSPSNAELERLVQEERAKLQAQQCGTAYQQHRAASFETIEAEMQQIRSSRRCSIDQQVPAMQSVWRCSTDQQVQALASPAAMTSGEQLKQSSCKNRFSRLSIKELEMLVEEEKQKARNRAASKIQKVTANLSCRGKKLQDPISEGNKEQTDTKSTKTCRHRKKKDVILDPQAASEEAELRMNIQQSLQNQSVECATAEDGGRFTIDTDKRLEQKHGFVNNKMEVPAQVGASTHRISLETGSVEDENDMQFHSFGDILSSFDSIMDESFASLDDDALLESKMELAEWILLQKMNATNDLSENKQYFEKALCILNSLILKMIVAAEQDGDIDDMLVDLDPKLITVENIIVVNEDNAYFARTESLNPDNDPVEMKYEAMKALGVLTYELLTRGDGPPFSSCTSTLSESRSLQLLCITGDDEKAGDVSDNSVQPKRKKNSNHDAGGISSVMSSAGVPYPLIRFTLDLLGGESSDGVLFRSDDSFQSFSDIVMEIEQ